MTKDEVLPKAFIFSHLYLLRRCFSDRYENITEYVKLYGYHFIILQFFSETAFYSIDWSLCTKFQIFEGKKCCFLPLLDASYRNVIKTNVLELKHLGQVITDTFFIGATVLKKTLKN